MSNVTCCRRKSVKQWGCFRNGVSVHGGSYMFVVLDNDIWKMRLKQAFKSWNLLMSADFEKYLRAYAFQAPWQIWWCLLFFFFSTLFFFFCYFLGLSQMMPPSFQTNALVLHRREEKEKVLMSSCKITSGNFCFRERLKWERLMNLFFKIHI